MAWKEPSRQCTGSADSGSTVSAGAAGVCQTEIVPEFCTCGAQLPPDARFCHKCGKPQYDYPGVEEVEPATPPAEIPILPPTLQVQLSNEISFHNRLAVRVGFIAALTAVFVFLV